MSFGKFQEKLGARNPDAMVVVKSKEYGFIWQGRVKYMSNNFMPKFFDRKIVEIKQCGEYITLTY